MTEVAIIFGKMKIIPRNFFFDNKFCKGLNKNSIIALNNTSLDHDKQKSPPAKSCIPIFTEKLVAMVTIMQMR